MFSFNHHQSTESSLFWNGSQWVQPSKHSTQSCATEQSTAETIPPHPIATYTDYYHKWMEKYSEQETLIASSTIRTPQDSEDMQRQLQWYKYYADQSSRAAHYFYSIGEENATRAPFDLPPEPPQYAIQTIPVNSRKQVQQQLTQTEMQQTSARSSAATVVSSSPSRVASRGPSEERTTPAPDSLKRYVDRCLSQYQNSKDKTKVMEIVAETISSSVKNGTMKSINWDLVPLIKLEAAKSATDISRSESRSRSISCSTGNSSRRRGTRGRGRRFGSNSSAREDSSVTSSTNKRSNDQTSNLLSSSLAETTPSVASNLSSASLSHDECSRSNKRQRKLESKCSVPSASTSDKVKGTNHTLEKNYLRLTGPAKPEHVRPQAILEEHLTNLKAMRSSGSQRNYNWFCSQLKAIRQDLTVQHLHLSSFAVDVYETHARFALRVGDLDEFNQCQTRLQELYLSFDSVEDQVVLKNRNEFASYGILYCVLMSVGNKDSFDLLNILKTLSYEQRQDASVKYALRIHEAMTQMNYHGIYLMVKSAPNDSCFLVDKILSAVKKEAKAIIEKAYKSKEVSEMLENYEL